MMKKVLMEQHTLDEHKDFLVEESKDDFLSLHLFQSAVQSTSDLDPQGDRMEQTLDLLRWAFARGFQIVNLSREEPGYVPWPDQDPERAIATIRDHWRATDEGEVGFWYWFHLPEEKR